MLFLGLCKTRNTFFDKTYCIPTLLLTDFGAGQRLPCFCFLLAGCNLLGGQSFNFTVFSFNLPILTVGL
jgi:hypothetical protein